jgi:hypothetical protein
MAREVFVGDVVECHYADRFVRGHVLQVTGWRESLEGLDGASARTFTAECELRAGAQFRDRWVRIAVDIGGKTIIAETPHFKVIHGRMEKDDARRTVAAGPVEKGD